MSNKLLRYVLQFRVKLLANQGRDLGYRDLELCAKVFEPFLNCSTAMLFVSHLDTFALPNLLDL
jgi:hypothetical protein